MWGLGGVVGDRVGMDGGGDLQKWKFGLLILFPKGYFFLFSKKHQKMPKIELCEIFENTSSTDLFYLKISWVKKGEFQVRKLKPPICSKFFEKNKIF